jgi:hypothetical protein
MEYQNNYNNTKTTNQSVQSFQLYCHYCAKGYKTRNRLEKHVTLCEIIYKSKNTKNTKKNENNDDEDDDELPSQRRLYQMLIELSQKYNRLEEKVDKMNKWVTKEKKKINVIEWLNENVKPNDMFVFETYHEKLKMEEEDIQQLFQTSFYEVFHKLVSNAIENVEVKQRTFFSFQQKPNQIYIYQQEGGWQVASREKLTQFINRCHRKVTKALSEWKKLNTQKINGDDKYAIQYDKTLSKLMSLEWKNDATWNKSKNILHTIFSIDMKQVIEYEFEF